MTARTLGPGRDEMRDFGSLSNLEPKYCGFLCLVRLCYTLVLSQMVFPRVRKEGFDEAAAIAGVFEDAPAIGAVAAPLSPDLLDSLEERLAILGIDPVVYGDEDWSSRRVDVTRRSRRWPAHGGC
jgi:hypothetical protein